MNWLSAIKKVLGEFWTTIYSDTDFILGVELMNSMSGKVQEAITEKSIAQSDVFDTNRYQDTLPFPVYLIKSKIEQGASPVSCILREPATLESILAGTASTGDRQTHGGWTCQTLYTIPEPFFISDHVIHYTRTLFKGIDYDFDGHGFLFHSDPASIGFPEVTVSVDGVLYICYKAMGFALPSKAIKAMACACSDVCLNDQADIVWDMHVNGASHYTAKKLLATATYSVVSDVDGAVMHKWTEQGYTCVQINDTVYSAPQTWTARVNHGDTVHKGDILFGDLRYIRAADITNTEPTVQAVPGMHVMTDAGELTATNQTLPAVVQSGVNILPLSGDAATVAAYKAICVARASDTHADKVSVPSTVNPFKFIQGVLRKASSIFISVTMYDGELLLATLNHIRRCTSASSILNVYVNTVSSVQPITITADDASVFQAAVSEIAAIHIEGNARGSLHHI